MLHWVLRIVNNVTWKVETYQNLKKYPRKNRRETYFKNIENFTYAWNT